VLLARVSKVSLFRWPVMIAITCVAILLSGCSGGPSESELAHVKQVASEAQARNETLRQLKDKAVADKAAEVKAVAVHAAAVHAAGVKAAAVHAAAVQAAAVKATAAKAAVLQAAAAKAAAVKVSVPQGAPVSRDANGFALGGPPCRATLWMTTWTPKGVTVGDDGRLGLDPWQEESTASPA
jgi:hypothetical protein